MSMGAGFTIFLLIIWGFIAGFVLFDVYERMKHQRKEQRQEIARLRRENHYLRDENQRLKHGIARTSNNNHR